MAEAPAYNVDDILNTASITNNLVNKYVVSPLVNLGIAGFVFNTPSATSIELSAEISKHFLEDNSTAMDNIALNPDRIVTGGYIGELINEVAEPKTTLQKLAEKITTINALVPVLTTAAKSAQQSLAVAQNGKTTDILDAGISAGVDLYGAFKALNPPKTNQAKAFNFFKALFDAKQLVSIETPYSFYSSMAIESISAVQDEDSKYISTFSLTLVKIRTTKTQLVAFDPKKYQGRVAGQASVEQNKGRNQGVKKGPLESALYLLNKTFR